MYATMGSLHPKNQTGSQIIGGQFQKNPGKKKQQKIPEAPLFSFLEGPIAFFLRTLGNLSGIFFLPLGDSGEFYRHGHLCSGDSLKADWESGRFVCWLVGCLCFFAWFGWLCRLIGWYW